jgi:hypothetical protein
MRMKYDRELRWTFSVDAHDDPAVDHYHVNLVATFEGK